MEVPASARVGDLHHMRSLAQRLGGHTAGIFEIELDLLPWLPQLQRLRLAVRLLSNTARLTQDLPDRRLRARQAHAGVFEGGIALQILQDGFWAGDALQVLWRCAADLQDALDDRQL